jgi:hypothetical protein
LGELLGIERFGSPDTLRRLFLRFGYREVTEVSERLMRFSLTRMRPILLGHTLDLDSTVLCRYGEQEGSLKGYNLREALPGTACIAAVMVLAGIVLLVISTPKRPTIPQSRIGSDEETVRPV